MNNEFLTKLHQSNKRRKKEIGELLHVIKKDQSFKVARKHLMNELFLIECIIFWQSNIKNVLFSDSDEE